jgi:uncharacterized protein
MIHEVDMNEKYKALLSLLKGFDGAALAFSGGVDSTFLLAAAKEALGDRVLAVIGRSPTYPRRELEAAQKLADHIGARYRVVDTDEMQEEAFYKNPPTRCFACKTTLLGIVRDVAEEEGLKEVIEGSNADDTGDYRPGLAAIDELGVRSPLLEVGMTKGEIRELSKEMGLPTWDKPAMACLSSRIPYGEDITLEKLERIEQTENGIRDLGVQHLRVRDHGKVARIELAPNEIARMAAPEMRARLVALAKAAGYQYVALDLEGYRTGAMNEVLATSTDDD